MGLRRSNWQLTAEQIPPGHDVTVKSGSRPVNLANGYIFSYCATLQWKSELCDYSESRNAYEVQSAVALCSDKRWLRSWTRLCGHTFNQIECAVTRSP